MTAPSLNWTEQPNDTAPALLPIYDGHCVWVKTGKGNSKAEILLVESNGNVSGYNWINKMDVRARRRAGIRRRAVELTGYFKVTDAPALRNSHESFYR